MSRLPLARMLFFLTVPSMAVFAGRPTNGTFYFTFSRDFSGANIGKVDWSWDGRQVFSVDTPTTFFHLPEIYALAYLPDQTLLVSGKYKNQVYDANTDAKTFDTLKGAWSLPEHFYVEPGLKSVWITDQGGTLYKAPIAPVGDAATVRPTGSEKGINTLAYKDLDHVWYTQSTLFDSTHIGSADPRTMATARIATIKPFVNDMHYDPFTRHLVMCGDNTLSQFDPATGLIVSQRVFPHVSELYSCVVDGEGHIILSSWGGFVYFIDYSATGKINDAGNFTDSLELLEGMYYIAPLIGPGSPPVVHRPFYAGTKVVYADSDGDGRIDNAVIEFNNAVYDPPTLVRVPVPGSGKTIDVDSTHISRVDATHFRLDFHERPFDFGTGVPPGKGGKVLQDTTLFGAGPLAMGDGVGPQAVTAEARPPQDRGDKPMLTVTFSEPVNVDVTSRDFPFEVRRPGADLDGQIQVESVRALGGNRFQYVFSSAEYPLLGDSLRLTPGGKQVVDSAGNLSNMSIEIEVGGLPFPVFSIQPEKLPSVVSYVAMGSPVPAAPPVLLIDPAHPEVCLNCPDGRIGAILAAAASAPNTAGFEPWILTVMVQGPIRYDLDFYSTLGEFVNRGTGVVDVPMLQRLHADGKGRFLIRLYWWPVSAEGRHAATGAYIMRGSLSGDGLKNPLVESSQHPLSLPKKTEKITARFGYLRR